MYRSTDLFTALCVFLFSYFRTSAGTHSLQFLYTAVTKGINLPEFTAVGQVDGEQVIYYDSNIRTLIPKREWINKDESHWNDQEDRMRGDQDDLKHRLITVMKQFNHTTGIHTIQRMFGCELAGDETIRGYEQYGYDGEDFLILDLKTLTWTAATDKALITKQEFERHGYTMVRRDYLENECIDWLKKYVSYGRETLERKVPPEVQMFQNSSSSPELVCHATGFFPKGLNITWQKNGEDLIEDVELRETLPNQDGSFQKRSILKVSPEDLQKHEYTCVIKHSSLKEGLVLKARERRILRVPPEVQMFQNSSSSPELVCHATGFFPKGLNITWQKDGEDLIEDVELRETLPNQDGSFQRRSILKVSPEDLQKHNYSCVIKHSSLKEDLVLKARERRILRDGGSGGGSGGGSDGVPIGIIVGAVVGVLALVLIVAGIPIWKKKKSGFRPVPPREGSDGDSGSGSSAV